MHPQSRFLLSLNSSEDEQTLISSSTQPQPWHALACSILASDVLYFEVQVHPLVHTLQRRLKRGGFALVLITVRQRTTATVRAFENALEAAGLRVSSSDVQVCPLREHGQQLGVFSVRCFCVRALLGDPKD